MTAFRETFHDFPDWLPATARTYLRHTADGISIRALARASGCHASTMLRQVRRYEQRRDDLLVDEGLDRIGGRAAPDAAAQQVGEAERADGQPRGQSGMTVQIRAKPKVADGETLAREARRVLRRLTETGAVLAVAPDMDKAVVLKGHVRIAVVDRGVAEAFALKDWIAVARQGKVATYEITQAGRAALKRMMAHDASASAGSAETPAAFADQHRDWDERAVAGSRGDMPRRVRVNLAESPLTALARRRDKDGELFLSTAQVAAGERLREDFELAQIGPRVAQNWDRFLTAGSDGSYRPEPGAGGSQAARDRVAVALRELGPGLGDMVLRACCFLEGLEVAEKRLGWSARSGKIVLRIALTRLIRHYEETYGKGLPLIG